jgi:hypothetical protein
MFDKPGTNLDAWGLQMLNIKDQGLMPKTKPTDNALSSGVCLKA